MTGLRISLNVYGVISVVLRPRGYEVAIAE